jgi:molybdenum cofactor cytidylyltransferase
VAGNGVLGVIPAAGRSTRIGGGPKPLLETGSGTFLARVVRALRDGGVGEVVVGVRDDPGPVAAEARRCGAKALVPEGVDEGPIATVRSVLRRTEAGGPLPAAIVLLPADYPLVSPSTVAAVLAAWRRSGASLVRPRHEGRTGHPPLFAGPLLDALLSPHLPRGARSVVEEHGDEAVLVDVDNPGILVDVDTLPEYRRHFPDAFRRRFQKW